MGVWINSGAAPLLHRQNGRMEQAAWRAFADAVGAVADLVASGARSNQ